MKKINRKTKSPQLKAWETMRFNNKVEKLYGFPKEQLSLQRIKSYLKRYKPTKLISEILENSNHSVDFISKKLGKPKGIIERFLPSAIQSVVMDTPQVGKKVVLSSLVPKKEVVVEKKKRGRPKGSKNRNTEKIDSEKVFDAFKHEGKNTIHDNLERLVLNTKSPKKGDVATLAGDMKFEYRLYRNKKLKSLKYHSFEESYSVGKSNISNVRYVEQQKFLDKHPKFSHYVSLTKGNINHFVPKVKEDSYAHLFLDYCNSLNKNENYVKEILNNKSVKVGGLVWLTFSTRSGSKDIKNRLPKLFKESCGNSYVNEVLKGKNIKSVTDGIYTYNKMYVTILRRVK